MLAGTTGLVFAAVAPHGFMCIREAAGPHERDLARPTRAAMEELGRRLAAAAPEVVVITTPHGIHVQGAFAVVVASRAGGVLEGTTVRLGVPVDRDLAAAAIHAMREAGVPALAVSFGGNDPTEAEMPMD